MPGGVHEFMKAWEPEEDQIIIEMLDRLGPKWSKIVKRLPGRTVSSVRNRWQRIDKGRKLREAGLESKNRCQQCGKPKRGHVCMARLKNRGESGLSAEHALQQWEMVTDAPKGEGYEGEISVPNVSRGSSAASAAPRLEGGAAADAAYPDYEGAVAPLLSKMKSGPRICRELGFSFGGPGGSFSALAAAAEAELQRSESCSSLSGSGSSCSSTAAAPSEVIEPSSVSRMSSSSLAEGEAPRLAADISRLPSLLCELRNSPALQRPPDRTEPPKPSALAAPALATPALAAPALAAPALAGVEAGVAAREQPAAWL